MKYRIKGIDKGENTGNDEGKVIDEVVWEGSDEAILYDEVSVGSNRIFEVKE